MKRTLTLSMLFVAIAAVIALAPAYLKRNSVSATTMSGVFVFKAVPITNGQVTMQDFLDSVLPGTQLQGTARLSRVNADADLTILNRTNLCPPAVSATFGLRIIDNNTGAILASLSGSVPPGGQFNVDSIRALLSSGAFDANGVADVRIEAQTFPKNDFVKLDVRYRQVGVNPITAGGTLVPELDLPDLVLNPQ